MIKKTLASAILLTASSASFAVAPGGSDCGWGNMLMEGQSGHVFHFLASTTNGTSGNATFGMTTGTNGCAVDGSLTYGGKSLIASIMGEFSEDVAQGQGEAVNAVAVSMGVEKTDREHFVKVMHDNFSQLFTSAEVTSSEVYDNMISVMQNDATLSKYAS